MIFDSSESDVRQALSCGKQNPCSPGEQGLANLADWSVDEDYLRFVGDTVAAAVPVLSNEYNAPSFFQI